MNNDTATVVQPENISAGIKHTAEAQKPSIMAKATAMVSGFTTGLMDGMTRPAIAIIAAVALTVAGVYIATPMAAVNTAVQFETGRVSDKGWFSNWLWRTDPSKSYEVKQVIQPAGFMGSSSPEVLETVVQARRGKEVTQYVGSGIWRTVVPAK